MNSYIASHLRHLLTCLATLGVLLASHKLIDPSQTDAVNQAGSALVNPLTVIGTAFIVVGLRLAITFLGKIFPGLAATLTGMTGNPSGGVGLLMLVGMAACFMGCMPSCSSAQLDAAKTIPINATVHTNYGAIGYSSKSGISLDVDATSGK